MIGHRLLKGYSIRKLSLEILKELWLPYLLASILILYGFGWGLPDNPYQDKSFQHDEGAAVWAVTQISFPGFNPQWLPCGTALFYQVYLLKTVFTGGGLVHISNFWIYVIGRLVVYASAMGAITLIFLLGRKLFNTWTGRLAAIILAVLPGFVINSHYFKTDVPMTFWSLAAMLVAYLLISSGKSAYVILMGLLVGYSASVKYNAVVLFPAGLVAIAMVDHKLNKRRLGVAYLACVAAGFIFGEPYAVLNVSKLLHEIQWAASINKAGNPYYLARPPAWIDYPVNVLPFSLTLPMLMVAASGLIWAAIKEGKRLLPVWAFLLFYYALLGMDNYRIVRYTVPMLPFAALFVAYLIKVLRDIRIVQTIAIPGVCAIIVYAFLFSLSYVQVMAQTDPRIQAMFWIEKNILKDPPVPFIPAHYLNLPQIQLVGYKKLEVGHSIKTLQKATSPYLILSEFGTRFFQEAIDFYPQQKEFFAYVGENYAEVVHFENSQKLLGIDSKPSRKLPQDWLHPNPRITILKRRDVNTTSR